MFPAAEGVAGSGTRVALGDMTHSWALHAVTCLFDPGEFLSLGDSAHQDRIDPSVVGGPPLVGKRSTAARVREEVGVDLVATGFATGTLDTSGGSDLDEGAAYAITSTVCWSSEISTW